LLGWAAGRLPPALACWLLPPAGAGLACPALSVVVVGGMGVLVV